MCQSPFRRRFCTFMQIFTCDFFRLLTLALVGVYECFVYTPNGINRNAMHTHTQHTRVRGGKCALGDSTGGMEVIKYLAHENMAQHQECTCKHSHTHCANGIFALCAQLLTHPMFRHTHAFFSNVSDLLCIRNAMPGLKSDLQNRNN